MRSWVWIGWLGWITSSLATAGTVPDLETIRTQYRVPALATAIWDGKASEDLRTQVVAVGRRRVDLPAPVLTTDAFHLGSNTKAMTATLVALLIQEGRLKWDSTLGELLGTGEGAVPMHEDFKRVTIEMLLAHRSGLPENEGRIGDEDFWSSLFNPSLDPMIGRKRFTELALSQKPESTPGEAFHYSNAGYVVVGYVIEKLLGRSWESQIRSRIFEPLEMDECGFGPVRKGPWGHRIDGDAIRPVKPGIFADNAPTLGPAGTVHCPLLSYLRFLKLHLDGFQGRPRMLDAQSFSQLHRSAPNQTYTYGGWERIEIQGVGPLLGHAGSNTFNFAVAWILPTQEQAWVSATNAPDPRGGDATYDVMGRLLRSLKDSLALP